MNEFGSERQLIDKEIEVAKLKSELAETQLNLLSANYTLKRKELEELKKSLKEQLDKKRDKNEVYKEFTKKIKEDLKLPERWGFDPETGEIKHD